MNCNLKIQNVHLSCNLLGSLNMVAPLITDFYLIAYCVINLSCFVSSMSKSPGWRPSFKWFNKYLALLGSVLCIMFMILSDWMYAIIALFIGFTKCNYKHFSDRCRSFGCRNSSMDIQLRFILCIFSRFF